MNNEAIPQVPLVPSQERKLNSPGAKLKRAREAAKMSINEIANQLHLTTRCIEGLEADDYSVVPSKVFVKGYLRSYAKAVNLAPEEVIAAYTSLGLPEEAAPIVNEVLYKRSNRVSLDFLTPWITGLFLIGTLALLFLWWRSQHYGPNNNVNVSKQIDLGVHQTIAPTNTNSAQKIIIPVNNSVSASASNVTTSELGNTSPAQTVTTGQNSTTAPVTNNPAQTNTGNNLLGTQQGVPSTNQNQSITTNPAIFPVTNGQGPISNVTNQAEQTNAAGNTTTGTNTNTVPTTNVGTTNSAGSNTVKVNKAPAKVKPKQKAVLDAPF